MNWRGPFKNARILALLLVGVENALVLALMVVLVLHGVAGLSREQERLAI
jgi:hypothetical protein